MRKRLILTFLIELVVISSLSFFVLAAGKKANPWDQKKDGSCAIGRLCKGTVDANSKTAKESNCHPAGTEGCLTDYRDDSGKFCYTIRNPDCGKKEEVAVAQPTPTPTPVFATPTPTPTPTVTPTPTPGPTATPTPTPTPTPPKVVVVRTVPRQLPPTGFPTDAVAGGAAVSGGIGWFILKKFRA